MTSATESLRLTEVAVVAQVPLRDVNRAIDEHILPEDLFTVEDGRRVRAAACSFIAFYFESAARLTSEERLRTIREAGSRLRALRAMDLSALAGQDWTVRHEFLTVDLASFVKNVGERMERLSAARDLVAIDPEVLGGTPVIRGTRIPVHDVAASVAAGLSTDRLLAAYPALDAGQIELAAIYAEANPARGRPRSRDGLPKGAAIVSDRRVPRHGKPV